MEMSFKEAAEVLRNPVAGMRVITLDGKPEVCLTQAYCRAIEVALKALEYVESQAETILELNRDLKRCREALNAQGEYAYLGGDLISREALVEKIEVIDWYSVNGHMVMTEGAADEESAYVRYADVTAAIERALAVEAELVVHAHWKAVLEPNTVDNYGEPVYHAECSRCGCYWGYVKRAREYFKRCPHCGAYMDEEVADV